ncbi:hypothetical protein KVR01_002869 [Diaporthe batatas]|uniref:uncharacterized protein n=1 Tax=Diaporthe batatas TaxID=748121 RepID=UPI001D04084C|nr:uncharacterized protein KVR01_002869 [Diaporthe batatas]KAG8167180.1 hypothetical protein KVR01_002869 [Diaporthe batatas]
MLRKMHRRFSFFSSPPAIAASLLLAGSTFAIELNTTDTTSISAAASRVASGLFKNYYNNASTAGHFNQPQPWYWWLSGSGWNGLLDYTVYTRDTQYQTALLAAISDNLGSDFEFAPAEQQSWEANDDQMYWVYNALTAMEYNLTAVDGAPSWVTVAENAFNAFARRWEADSPTCGGGLKWQYTETANGYFYKNAVTNGGFLQTSARLARYTGNATYAEWATKIWDWSAAVGLVGPKFNVFDGTSDEGADNCTQMSADQWSYNVATFMMGAGNMYAYNGAMGFPEQQVIWGSRVDGLVAAANATFFSPPTNNATGVMYEQKCEVTSACNLDQTSFKSSLSRWMGKTAVLVPRVRDDIMALLATSATAAAASCTDGTSEISCGMKWWTADGYDGYTDFGSQLSALEVIQSLLVTSTAEPATLIPAA